MRMPATRAALTPTNRRLGEWEFIAVPLRAGAQRQSVPSQSLHACRRQTGSLVPRGSLAATASGELVVVAAEVRGTNGIFAMPAHGARCMRRIGAGRNPSGKGE